SHSIPQPTYNTISRSKRHVHADNVNATFKNAKIADYETCLIVGQAVRRRANIRSYSNDIEALTHIAVFKHVRKMTPTKAIYKRRSEEHTSELQSRFEI